MKITVEDLIARMNKKDGNVPKKEVNPCTCLQLETRAKIVAWIQMIFYSALALVIVATLVLFVQVNSTVEKKVDVSEQETNGGLIIIRVLILVLVVALVFVVDILSTHKLLLNGIKERNHGTIALYLTAMTMLVVINFILAIMALNWFPAVVKVVCVVHFIFELYTLWVISCFKQGLERAGADDKEGNFVV